MLVEAGGEDGEQGPPDDLVQPLGRDAVGGEVLGGPSLGHPEPGDVEPGVGGRDRVADGVLEQVGHGVEVTERQGDPLLEVILASGWSPTSCSSPSRRW